LPEGKNIKTVYNGDFRKSKPHLAKKGYTCLAVKVILSIYDKNSNGERNSERQIYKRIKEE